MKNLKYVLGAAAICLALAAQANAQSVTSIVASPHNLNTDAGVSSVNSHNFTAEVCLPCHVPHNAPYNGGDLLWNHKVTASTTSYKLYNNVNTTAFSGTTSANPQLDQTTVLCLSCHDGSIAIDSYGGGKSNNVMIASWAGVANTATNSSDLSLDHPLGVGYPGLPAESSVLPGSFTPANANFGFTDPTVSGPFTTGGVGGIPAVKLVALPTGYMGVGCISCHEPHDWSQKFMRISNNGSAVCLSCHIK
jgi:predicted CXXCH cytochrome family protein